MVNAFLDVADGFEIFIQLLAIAVADLRPERARLSEDGVEDAAIELTALAIAKQLVEEARRIDFFGGGFGRRHPRDVRTVNHREAVFQPQLVRLDSQRQTRRGGSIADALRQHLIKRGPYTDLFRVQTDRRAGEQIHSAQVRAGGNKRLLMIKPAQEDQVFADWRERARARAEFHVFALPLSPPVNRLDSIGKENVRKSNRRFVRIRSHRNAAVLRKKWRRFHPWQSKRHTRASQKLSPRCLILGFHFLIPLN